MKRVHERDVREAVRRVRLEMTRALHALEARDPRAIRNAFERAQHRAFEGKALFQDEELPPQEEEVA